MNKYLGKILENVDVNLFEQISMKNQTEYYDPYLTGNKQPYEKEKEKAVKGTLNDLFHSDYLSVNRYLKGYNFLLNKFVQKARITIQDRDNYINYLIKTEDLVYDAAYENFVFWLVYFGYKTDLYYSGVYLLPKEKFLDTNSWNFSKDIKNIEFVSSIEQKVVLNRPIKSMDEFLCEDKEAFYFSYDVNTCYLVFYTHYHYFLLYESNDDDSFFSFLSNLESIKGFNCVSQYGVGNYNGAFKSCEKLKEISIDILHGKTFNNMFADCKSLKKVELTIFDNGNVEVCNYTDTSIA